MRRETDLGEQGRSRGAEVVGDEQLRVRVDPRWVELPQWLEGVGWGGGGGGEHRETWLSTVAHILKLLRVDSAYHPREELKQQRSETPPVTRLRGSGHPTDFCKRTRQSLLSSSRSQLFTRVVLPPLGGR